MNLIAKFFTIVIRFENKSLARLESLRKETLDKLPKASYYKNSMFSRHSIWQSLHYSLSGISYLFKEYSFQEELLIGFILWSISLWRIGWSSLQALLTLAWGIVLLTEAFNSAIETIVDLVSPQQHILAKKSKDIASAAVFIAIIGGITVFIFCMTVRTHE